MTSGRGWYQTWGEPARELHPGDVVEIPADVKHWHGAAKDSRFSHLAVEIPADFVEDRLHRLVRQAIEKDEITMSRGAEILRTDLEAMRDVVSSWV